MAAYRRVYDSRQLQADMPRTGISSGTLRSVIEYGLPFPLPCNPALLGGACPRWGGANVWFAPAITVLVDNRS